MESARAPQFGEASFVGPEGSQAARRHFQPMRRALPRGSPRVSRLPYRVILRPAIEAEEFWTFEQNGTVAPVFESPHRI